MFEFTAFLDAIVLYTIASLTATFDGFLNVLSESTLILEHILS